MKASEFNGAAQHTQGPMRVYEVKLIHRLHDWDAILKYAAPDAKTARKWALRKMATPPDWLITRAAIAKPHCGASQPAAAHLLWYVEEWEERCWFEDELTARVYLLLVRAAFKLRPGIDLFLGRDVPPEIVAEAVGGTA